MKIVKEMRGQNYGQSYAPPYAHHAPPQQMAHHGGHEHGLLSSGMPYERNLGGAAGHGACGEHNGASTKRFKRAATSADSITRGPSTSKSDTMRKCPLAECTKMFSSTTLNKHTYETKTMPRKPWNKNCHVDGDGWKFRNPHGTTTVSDYKCINRDCGTGKEACKCKRNVVS